VSPFELLKTKAFHENSVCLDVHYKKGQYSYTLKVGRIRKPFWKFWGKEWLEEYNELSEKELLYKLSILKVYSLKGGTGKTSLANEVMLIGKQGMGKSSSSEELLLLGKPARIDTEKRS
jgi:hypothetical protein